MFFLFGGDLMADTLEIFGTEYTNVAGIKATDNKFTNIYPIINHIIDLINNFLLNVLLITLIKALYSLKPNTLNINFSNKYIPIQTKLEIINILDIVFILLLKSLLFIRIITINNTKIIPNIIYEFPSLNISLKLII